MSQDHSFADLMDRLRAGLSRQLRSRLHRPVSLERCRLRVRKPWQFLLRSRNIRTRRAAVTLLAKERKGPRIRYQVLFYPVTNADFTTESYSEFADGPWLTKPAMEWFWEASKPATM